MGTALVLASLLHRPGVEVCPAKASLEGIVSGRLRCPWLPVVVTAAASGAAPSAADAAGPLEGHVATKPVASELAGASGSSGSAGFQC